MGGSKPSSQMLEKILFILESELLCSGTCVDFSCVKRKLREYDSLQAFGFDVKKLISGRLDELGLLNPGAEKFRDVLIGVLKLSLRLTGLREEFDRYSLVRRTVDGTPYFSPSFFYAPSWLPSISVDEIGKVYILPGESIPRAEPLGALIPPARAQRASPKRKNACNMECTIKVLKVDPMNSSLPSISSSISSLSLIDSEEVISTIARQKQIEASSEPLYVSKCLQEICKEILTNKKLHKISEKLHKSDEILLDNALLMILIENFQNERFSKRVAEVSQFEREIAKELMCRFAALVKEIPPKNLISVPAIREAMTDIKSCESVYRGAVHYSAQRPLPEVARMWPEMRREPGTGIHEQRH